MMDKAMPDGGFTKSDAASELLARRRARQSFLEFNRYVAKREGYDEYPADHHVLICNALQKVAEGEIRNLMLFLPPGSAKSTYATIRFPAWYLGRYGRRGIISASYNSTLAEHFGKKVRDLVASDAYRAVFPACSLTPGTKAKGEWETQTDGFYFAAGVGEGITGRRGDLAIGDDLIKGRQDADSKTIRDKTWEWWKSDLRTRLKPRTASRVIIMCMVGSTPVLMADGTERALRDIRAGDEVATMAGDALTHSKVLNWINHGPDKVFSVMMKSGRVVAANARHPFRVIQENGEESWVRLESLSVGMLVRSAEGPTRQPLSTWTIGADEVLEIVEAGSEDVFDIEVERTHNFIANGLEVSNTRWHEDDPAGRILPEDYAGETGVIQGRDGGSWYVINIPAQARHDDPLRRPEGGWLWPQWFTPEYWEAEKFAQGPRNWQSLYQQTPTADDGTYFQKEWFRYYRDAPSNMTIYMSGDFAVTEGDGDFTELAVWGVDTLDNVYVVDWWHGQASADRWADEFIRMIDRWQPVGFAGEGGPIRRAVEPFLSRAMRDQKAWTVMDWLTGGDKEANARSFQAHMANGRIYWPKTDWAARVEDQLLRFPNGRYDDAVDTCSLFGRLMARTWAAAPKAVRKPDLDQAWTAPQKVSDFLTKKAQASW